LVNGVGANTARMILSGQTPSTIISAISTGNVAMMKSVKGVGPKTAQRIIMELQDKVGKISGSGENENDVLIGSSQNSEALLALQALGFQRNAADKVIQKISSHTPSLSVEEIIKQALKLL
jgi:Holliday junction DNA helicase RuvA